MGRNLVICCDGTSNKFGAMNTDVVRLVQILERDSLQQLVYYAPGVGTLPEPSAWTAIARRASILMGLAFGTGLTAAVKSAYAYLMDSWEPGDRVYLFGFSRGAYTVRVLAAMLHSLGLLPRGQHNLVPYAMELFDSSRGLTSSEGARSNYWKLSNQFRKTFARDLGNGEEQRRFETHFVGVWDTVSSVGWVWEPKSFPYTRENPSVSIVRHAVAVDERRAFFRHNLFEAAKDQDLLEVWFPGSHCDVGGGYEEESGMWRVSFDWMVDEAIRSGLLVNAGQLQKLRDEAPSEPLWSLEIHDSLVAKWWPAEYFPKKQWNPVTRQSGVEFGMGRPRRIPAGALMHESVLKRLRSGSYRPANLSDAFVAAVNALPDVPATMAYM